MQLPREYGAFYSAFRDNIHHSMRGTGADEGRRPTCAPTMLKAMNGWPVVKGVVDLFYL